MLQRVCPMARLMLSRRPADEGAKPVGYILCRRGIDRSGTLWSNLLVLRRQILGRGMAAWIDKAPPFGSPRAGVCFWGFASPQLARINRPRAIELQQPRTLRPNSSSKRTCLLL